MKSPPFRFLGQFAMVVIMVAMKGLSFLLIVAWLLPPAGLAQESLPDGGPRAASPERGYRLLVDKTYLPPDFDQVTFDQAWKLWPEPLRRAASSANPQERRRMAFARYGLTLRPGDESGGKPLQYVVDEAGNWTMNCFACHGGQICGQVIPGLPNSNYALMTLTEDIRAIKLRLGKPLTRMDIGSMVMPLGTTVGSTNAVMFGVALLALRDAELNLLANPEPPNMVHHDMDPPAWWHFRKRSHIYIDGFAPKGVRALMQFMLVKENRPEAFHRWEEDFRHVYAFLESLEAPPYPFSIDREMARTGERVFLQTCSECHGTYGESPTYPERIVPIDQIGTDRVRLDALSVEHRRNYGRSWFAHYGQHDTRENPVGYVAPPLDGVWATAPYFHNGSVPTLWHVVHPDERPMVWKRASDGYDQQKLGLPITELSQMPRPLPDRQARREYFDTRPLGKGAAGHLFPDQLTEEEKRAVLEYLKTL